LIEGEGDKQNPPLQVQENNGSSAITLETLPQSEVLISDLAITTPIPQEETNDLLLTNPFVEEETYELPVRVPASSVDWQDKDVTSKMALSLISRTNIPGVLTALRQLSRRRVLELALLRSAVMAVISSALWLSGRFTPDASSHTTQKIIQ